MDRRAFLKLLGISLAALSLPECYADMSAAESPSVFYADSKEFYWQVNYGEYANALAVFHRTREDAYLLHDLKIANQGDTALTGSFHRRGETQSIIGVMGIAPRGMIRWVAKPGEEVVFLAGSEVEVHFDRGAFGYLVESLKLL